MFVDVYAAASYFWNKKRPQKRGRKTALILGTGLPPPNVGVRAAAHALYALQAPAHNPERGMASVTLETRMSITLHYASAKK